MKRLVLIDGKSVFYRGYYAMGALGLADGTPTGGVYGFAAIAMEIVSKLKPTKVVVAWDSKTSVSRRREIYPEYKAGRVKPREDFYAQIPLLKELVAALGWAFVEVENYEADDIIGTLSLEADNEFGADGKCAWETFIISSDLDMLQIVDENTRMLRILKGFSEIEEIDVAEVEAKYKIRKSQFLDFKALKGDSSDNIPGVPGIGEKTAAELLGKFGDLDGIYRNLAKIASARTREKLVAGRDEAFMSRELARIMFDAPVELSEIPDFELNAERAVAGLKKLEFNSLIRKFKLEDGNSGANEERRESGENANENGRGSGDGKIWRESGKENTDEGSETGELPDKLPDDLILSWDVKALMHADAEKAAEILAGKKFWDLDQAEFLLNPLKREQKTLFDVADEKEKYAEQRQEFKKLPKLYRVFTELDLPLMPVLYKMEKKGMLIDREYFARLKTEYAQEVKTREREIWDLAGREFNINSPVQLAEVLFVDLRMPTKGIKKTQRGYSTGAKELEKLMEQHAIVPKIKEYREATKLLTTYIVPMADWADAEGRIHTTFTQNVTATGRLSSKDPNLQNIPVRTEEGKRIRTGFVAPKGKVLVSADYSQFELRLAAVLAGDEKLIADFNAGIDIHTKTAAEAFNIPFEKVTKEQRRAAKVINFGVLYGMSVNGLAAAAKMSFFEAKQFIENYFRLRAPIKMYLEKILRQAREEGFVETYFGRRRPCPDVKSTNFVIRQAAERAAMNMPIQGTEADLMKRAMIATSRKLPNGAELIMQVHDSLIVECDENLATEVAEILRQEMESVAPELKIKLAVEITIGENWGKL